MIRILNIVVVIALVAAAIGVYSIKYQSTIQAEKVAELRRKIEGQRTQISTLQAEWAFLSQPQRVSDMAKRHTDLQPMKITQVVRMQDVPERPAPEDLIAQKLDSLGLAAAGHE